MRQWRIFWTEGGKGDIGHQMVFKDMITAEDNLRAIRRKHPDASIWRWSGIQWVEHRITKGGV